MTWILAYDLPSNRSPTTIYFLTGTQGLYPPPPPHHDYVAVWYILKRTYWSKSELRWVLTLEWPYLFRFSCHHIMTSTIPTQSTLKHIVSFLVHVVWPLIDWKTDPDYSQCVYFHFHSFFALLLPSLGSFISRRFLTRELRACARASYRYDVGNGIRSLARSLDWSIPVTFF